MGVLRRKMVIEPEYPHNPHFKLHTKESKTEAEKEAHLQDGDEGHNSRRKERQNGDDDDDDDDDKVGDDNVSHSDEHKDEEKDEPKRGGHAGKGGARKDGDKSDEDMHDEKVSIELAVDVKAAPALMVSAHHYLNSSLIMSQSN